VTPAQVAERTAVDRARYRKACLLADVLEPRLAAGGWGPDVLTGPPRYDVSLDLVWAIVELAAGVSPASHATASYATRLAVVSELHRRARVAATIANDVFDGVNGGAG